jgi:hypothetical protein
LWKISFCFVFAFVVCVMCVCFVFCLLFVNEGLELNCKTVLPGAAANVGFVVRWRVRVRRVRKLCICLFVEKQRGVVV